MEIIDISIISIPLWKCVLKTILVYLLYKIICGRESMGSVINVRVCKAYSNEIRIIIIVTIISLLNLSGLFIIVILVIK